MLERYAVKVARTVLRGGSVSNVTPLPDHWIAGWAARSELELCKYRGFVGWGRCSHQSVTQTVGWRDPLNQKGGINWTHILTPIHRRSFGTSIYLGKNHL